METVDIDVQSLPADKRCLRIAMVTETYPPEVNGVAMTLARIVDGLHRLNHDLQLIRPRQKAPAYGIWPGSATSSVVCPVFAST